MIKRYETLVLAIPEITSDEEKAIETLFSQTVKACQGTILSFERWGKYRLAYPVRTNEYGVYYLCRFEVPYMQASAVTAAVTELCSVKKADAIARAIITELSPTASLEYVRPESLEEAPSRDVDTFIKENKMEGILNAETHRGRRSVESMDDDSIELLEA